MFLSRLDARELQLQNNTGLSARYHLGWDPKQLCRQVGICNCSLHTFRTPMDYRDAVAASLEFVMVARAPVQPLVHEMAARAADDVSTARQAAE